MLTSNNERLDGRRWNELRRFSCKINTHPTSADGSSYVEQGLTQVVCTVSGPHEPDGRSHSSPEGAHLNIELTISPFSTTERKRAPSRNDRRVQELCIALRRLFSSAVQVALYPRTVIDISLYIIAQDGGMLPACINAATLALIDAGISMQDYVLGISTGMYGSNALLDTTTSEENEVPVLTCAVIGKSERVSLLLMENKMPLDRLQTALEVSLSGAHSIRELMDQEVRRHGNSRLSKTVATQ